MSTCQVIFKSTRSLGSMWSEVKQYSPGLLRERNESINACNASVATGQWPGCGAVKNLSAAELVDRGKSFLRISCDHPDCRGRPHKSVFQSRDSGSPVLY